MAARDPTYDLAKKDADYPQRNAPPDRSLILCSHPRSGSTLLGEILYFARDLGCPLEYFHRGFRPAFEARWKTGSPADYLAAVLRNRTDPSGVFSTKLFWQDMIDICRERDPHLVVGAEELAPEDASEPFYRAMFAIIREMMPNPIFIHLTRTDVIRQAVSAVRATQSGSWRTIPGLPPGESKEPVRYDYDRILRAIGFHRWCQGHWVRFFEVNGLTPWPVGYENMKADLEAVIAALFALLDRPPPVLHVRMARQSDAETERDVLRFLKEHAIAHGASDARGVSQPEID